MADQKVALITGGGSGMGRLQARRLAAAGWKVAAADVNEPGLRETCEGNDIRPTVLDVTDLPAVRDWVASSERDLGPIHRVFNGAAIMPTGLLLDQSAELIDKVMRINYEGTVNVTMSALPGMVERRRGDLINFASIAGWVPTAHFGAYNASKFAVVAFTEVLYHENRTSGVRIACVCPPPVKTPLLEQATSQPATLAAMPPIAPEQVLDAIEAHLDRDELFVFPDAATKRTVRIRRWFPDLIWKRVHRAEGLP